MTNREELRRINSKILEISAESSDHMYRVNRSDAVEYFALDPKWLAKARAFFAELHEQGERAAFVDVCGDTHGRWLGADDSFAFNISEPPYGIDVLEKSRVHFTGDIFNPDDVRAFIQELKDKKIQPALVTFEPIVGLGSYQTEARLDENKELFEKVLWKRLEDALSSFIKIMRPGGFIYLGPPFSGRFENTRDFFQRKPQEEYQSTLEMQDFCKRTKLQFQMRSSIFGPIFFLRKPKKRKQRQKRD